MRWLVLFAFVHFAAGQDPVIELIGDGEKTFGQGVTLSCSTIDGSLRNFTWRGPGNNEPRVEADNLENDDTSKLRFTAIEADAGEYTCEVDGPESPESRRTATVDIEIVPDILAGPESVTLVYSTMLTTTLSCTAFGGNGAQLEFIWTSTVGGLDQDTQIETLNEDNSTTSTISTMILTVENIGRYICDVAYQSSPDDTDDLSATINIIPAVVEDPQDIIIGVGFGKNATFSCSANGGPTSNDDPATHPLVFTWTGPDGIDVSIHYTDTDGDIATSTLTLVNVTEDHEGNYSCSVAYNDEQSITSTSAVATLSAVSDPPTITETPKNNRTAEEGDTLSFTCTAVGNGTLNITWTLPSGEVVFTGITSGQVWLISSSLTVENVRASDGGNYTCVSENEAGTTESTASLYIGLYRNESLVESELRSTNGSYEILICPNDGFPVTYVWEIDMPLSEEIMDTVNSTANESSTMSSNTSTNASSEGGSGSGQPIDANDGDDEEDDEFNFVFFSTGRVLVFDPIQFGDEGVYRCVATSEELEEELSSDPVTVTISPEDGVSITPVDEVYQQGENVIFNCTSLGGPDNNVQWFKDGNNITDIIDSNTTTLELLNITVMSDGAIYTCVASNAAGSGNTSVSLNIRPEIIMDPMSEEITSGDSVIFSCSAEAFPEPDYQWYRVGGDLPNTAIGADTRQLNITPAVFGDQGVYFCNATSSGVTVSSDTATLTISPLGGVSIEPEDDTFADGETVALNCSTLGGPANTYQWMFNGETIVNEFYPSLNRTDVTADNGGLYTCIVTNPAGSDSNVTNVFIRPMIILNPVNVSVMNGTNQTNFTCDATGFPTPSFQWFREGDLNPLGSNTTTLIISPVVFGDEGLYYCNATSNTITVESTRATLSITPLVDVMPESAVDEVGGSFTFTCEVMGGPNNIISWKKDSQLLENETNSTLLLTDITVSDGGVYQCMVENDAGNDSDDGELFIAPIIITPPQDMFTNVSMMVNFSCVAEGAPVPSITWEYSGPSTNFSELIPVTISNGTTVESTLTISSVSYSQYGNYQCVANSSSIMRSTLAEATLHVSPFGSVGINQSTVNLDRGEVHTAMCSAEGGPGNNFTWTKDGEMGTVSDTAQLVISVTEAAVGGSYQCTVRNAAGSDSATLIVNVIPVLTEEPVDMNVTSTRTLSLNCSANGSPRPDILWLQNGSMIVPDDRISISNTSVGVTDITSRLTVTNTSVNDSGTYTCVAQSSTFSDVISRQAIVLIQDTPERPEDLTAINITSRSLVLLWVEPHHNNAPVTGYRVMYERPDFLIGGGSGGGSGGGNEGEVVLNTIEEMLEVTVLHPGVTYTFTVVAENEIGDSRASQPLIVTTLEEVPGAPPQNIMVMRESSTEILVKWEEVPEEERNGQVIEYEVEYTTLEICMAPLENLTANTTNATQLMIMIVLMDLEMYVNYSIRVRAYTSVGPGPYSEPVIEPTDQDVPDMQLIVRTSTLTPTEIEVEWDILSAVCQNGIVILYEVTYEPLQTFGELMTDSENITAPTNMTVLRELEEYVEYNITVKAYTIVGGGPDSVPITTRTEEHVPESPPDSVTTKVLSSTDILVNWEEVPAIDENGIIIAYEVEYTPLETFDGQISTNITNTTDLNITLDGLQEYVDYNISVRAYTSVGPGPYSEPVTNRTSEDVPASPPDSVTTKVLSSTDILVNWEEVPAIDENGIIIVYEVEYTPLETFDGQISSTNLTNTTNLNITLDELQEYVEYNISVRAYTSVGPGPYSESVTNRTSEDVPASPPDSVTTEVLSSTEILVNWEEVPAIDENGIIIAYEVEYTPLETFDGQISSTNLTNTTNLNITLDGLQEYVEYDISVRAYTSVGPGPYSESVTNRTSEDVPASPPDSVTTEVLSSTDILVNWERVPAIDENGIIIVYEVEYTPLETFDGQISTNTTNTTNLNIALDELQEYVEYDISVRAYTSVGPGPYSESVTNRTLEDEPVEPPQNVTATVISSTEIEVSWEEVPEIDQNGIITIYEIEYVPLETFDGAIDTQTVSTTGPVLSWNLIGLEQDVEYNISVRAYTSVGFGPYSVGEVERTEEDVPDGPPQNVRTQVLSSTEIQLFWEEVPAINRSGIIIEYGVVCDPQEIFAMTNITNTTSLNITLSGLEEYVLYNCFVRAYTSVGAGPYSEALINRTFEDVPASPPDSVTTEVLSSTDILVKWEEVPAIDENGIIIVYEVEYTPLETFDGQISTNTTNTTNLNITLDGLQEYVEYDISVRAYTSVGPGPYSEPVTNRTLEDVPASPTPNVAVVNVTSTTISLTWDEVPPIDRNGIITQYEVEYNQTTFSVNTSQTVTVVNDTAVELTELHEFVEYFIRVRPYNGAGFGQFSPTINQTTNQDVPSGFPLNITATALSPNTINVTWESFPDIDHNGILIEYEIQFNQTVAVVSHPPTDTVRVSASNDTVVLTGLGALLTYTISVRALTEVGPGPYNPAHAVAETFPDVPEAPPKPPPVNETEDIKVERPLEESVVAVTLRWEPPEVTGGDLTGYNVIVTALGEVDEEEIGRRRRRGTGGDNFLDNCTIAGTRDQNIAVDANVTQRVVDATANSVYEFQVRAVNALGAGPLSNATQFTTPESIPSMPQNLLVVYNSSTSLIVTWDHPLCDYGIRTLYNFTYEREDGSEAPVTETLGPDVLTRSIEGLDINTNYNITLCAATSVGCGPASIVTNKTDEDAPPPVSNVTIDSGVQMSDKRVQFNITWTKPDSRNGPFNYRLEYRGQHLDDYPGTIDTDEDTEEIHDTQEIFTIKEALPHANYTITLTPVNIKHKRDGPSFTDSITTIQIPPTAVTNLALVAQDSATLRVSWGLPEYPNGPVTRYLVYYRKYTGTQPPQPVLTGEDKMMTITNTEVTIRNLDPFTNYTVIVRAVGEGGEGLLTADSVIVNRTYTTTDIPPTPIPPTAIGRVTFIIALPDPTLIDSGPVIFYAIIMVRVTGPSDMDSVTPEQYVNAGPFDREADPQQLAYITAAWDNPLAVPPTFTVGNGSVTMANGIVYENVGLSSDTDYAYIIRFDIQSDTSSEPHTFYSKIVYVQTREDPTPNAAAIATPIVLILLITIVALVIALVVVWWWLKKRARKRLFDGVIAEYSEDTQRGIQMQQVVVNPNPISPFSGTMEPIPLNKFKDHVERMHSNDDYLFSEEYSSIEPSHSPTSIASHLSCNISKNRYANIVAYDHSRVKLTEDPNKEGSDYINANYIDGYKQKKGFIAAQGPNPDTVADFWRMVWEQGTATIVMLTNLEEKGRVKCHQYWPEDKSGLYGRIRVHLQESLVLADYTQRSFSLQMDDSKEERIIVQYHYTVWPDHGVPEYPTSLLQFVRKVAGINPENSGPIVVHCSAGVGRTGTFIALFSQLKRMKEESNFDIFGYVRAMRYKRNCMVQTEPQYVFIHDALLEAVECGVTEVQAREVQEQYKNLCEVDVETKVTGLNQQFDNLDRTIHRKLRRNTGTLQVNKAKNRYGANLNALPYDRNRCRLSAIPGVEGSDYINASFIDGYHQSKAFIATQGPLPDTQDDFWKLIWQQKCATIVMLTKEKEGGKAKCHRYWPLTGAELYGKLQVIFCKATEFTDYTLREFQIVDSQDSSSLNVKQFQYTDWPEESVPTSGSGLIDLIGQVQKWQRSSGDKPVIVHCSGGCGRTGTYVAVSILIERLKTEGVVDVFHTIRNLRLQRPGMVQAESQLEFCYKTILEYLESFELYDNFK